MATSTPPRPPGTSARDYVVTGASTDGQEIRKFGDTSIQKAIDNVLAGAPTDRKVSTAFVGYANGDEARVGVFVKKRVKAPGFLGWLGVKHDIDWSYGGTLTYNYAKKDLKPELWTAVYL